MIIPIRCFSCGKVIAGKWKRYNKLCEEQKSKNEDDDDKHAYFDKGHKDSILNEVGVDKMCCRRHLLTHVDLVDVL